jgi:hypothetical protein
MEVGPEFFGVVAGVLPTLAVALFIARRGGMSKKEERELKIETDANLGAALIVFGLTMLTLASIAFFSYAEIVALLALGSGGGTNADAAFLVVAVGVMLFFLTSTAIYPSARHMRESLQDAMAFVALGVFFLLIAGALAHLGYRISFLDLSWVFGWIG